MRFCSLLAVPAAVLFAAAAQAAPGGPAPGDVAVGRGIPSAYGKLGPAPARFAARYGGEWFERRGGPVGGFRRVFGEGIPVDPAAAHDDLVAVDAAERFFRDNEDLFPTGVPAADLALRGTVAWRGKRVVSFAQTLDGVPVEGSSAYVVMAHDRIVLFGVRLYPTAGADSGAAIGAKAAGRTALDALAGLDGAPEISGTPRHVLLPIAGDDSLGLRSAWSVRLRLDGRGLWTAYVDARRGDLIALRDERVTMSGAIGIQHHERNPGGGLVEGAGAFLDLVANGADVTTDADGVFGASGTTADVTGALAGPYVEVQNMTGDDVALAVTGMADGGSHLWASDGSEIPLAQLDVYMYALAVSNLARSLQPDLAWLGQPVVVRPNQPNFEGETGNAYCNAWSDGETINFLMAGSSGSYECNNAAMIGDIVYHEYGHSLHIQNAVLGVGVFDGSASEAFGDTMSVAMTHDSVIGRYFEVGGGGIRDVEPDMAWPDDYNPDEAYVHSNGLILGGALWDLRKLLVDEHGEADGHLAADMIFVDMLRLTEDIASSLEAALAADDDNGNLADGTPNACILYDAFEPHGLVQGGLGRVVVEHAPAAFHPDPAAPIGIEAEVYVPQEECATLGAVKVVYSADGGASWSEVGMTPSDGDLFSAQLPAAPAGTVILYRLEAEEADSGQWVVRPLNPAEPYYSLYVGPLTEILCDDFEGADDGGWTHELLAGQDQEGADDWMRATPKGTGGDPDGAFSGSLAWGNDLTPEDNWNGQYQADKTTTLRSPSWDLSAYGTVRLAFRRWLNVEDGFFDQARIYVNEQEVWSNAVSPGDDTASHTLHHTDSEWILFGVDVSEFAAGQSSVQIRFEMQSDSGMQFGGWTIDDFCLYTADAEEEPDAGSDAGDDGGADAGDADVTAGASGCDCDAAGAVTATSLLRALF